nr:hypothetical protein [Tanacetum cinerariifolium]
DSLDIEEQLLEVEAEAGYAINLADEEINPEEQAMSSSDVFVKLEENGVICSRARDALDADYFWANYLSQQKYSQENVQYGDNSGARGRGPNGQVINLSAACSACLAVLAWLSFAGLVSKNLAAKLAVVLSPFGLFCLLVTIAGGIFTTRKSRIDDEVFPGDIVAQETSLNDKSFGEEEGEWGSSSPHPPLPLPPPYSGCDSSCLLALFEPSDIGRVRALRWGRDDRAPAACPREQWP